MVLAVALLMGGQAFAEVKLHALFSDNAVLQQSPAGAVWGAAGDPGFKPNAPLQPSGLLGPVTLSIEQSVTSAREMKGQL